MENDKNKNFNKKEGIFVKMSIDFSKLVSFTLALAIILSET